MAEENMVKLIEMITRKEGLTHEEFSRYWEEKHGPLVARITPKLKRYVQNHPVKLGKGGNLPFDGIAELWYDSLKGWRESADWLKGEGGKELLDDAKNFVDRTKLVVLVCEEKEIKVR
jgi:uncharacterized protein (TIGR02118 family)